MPIDWGKIPPEDFEKLCYRVLEKEGFFNLEWYGAAGQDRGRDIIGYREETPLPGQRVQKKWLVQCKRFLTPLSKKHLYAELVKAVEHNPDGILFMVSTALSANLRDWLKVASKQFTFEYVFVWDTARLESILSRYADIQEEFFGTRNKAVDELLETIQQGESQHIEFKEDLTSPKALVREICAFANTKGGRVLLGVKDDGSVAGFKDAQFQDKVQNWCDNLCDPPIRDIEIHEYVLPGGPVTVIDVPEGRDKPYFGSNQVCLRVGNSVRNATREEIGKYFARRGFLQYSPDLDFSIDLETYRKLLSAFLSMLEKESHLKDRIASVETLIETLLSGVNGFAVRSRVRGASAEFDFIITNKATNPFLSRLDLYIVVEWKVGSRRYDAATVHAVCSRAAMLGTKTAILFAPAGLTKAAQVTIAEVYQRDRFQILVLERADLERIGSGENFISLLEAKHGRLTLGV